MSRKERQPQRLEQYIGAIYERNAKKWCDANCESVQDPSCVGIARKNHEASRHPRPGTDVRRPDPARLADCVVRAAAPRRCLFPRRSELADTYGQGIGVAGQHRMEREDARAARERGFAASV